MNGKLTSAYSKSIFLYGIVALIGVLLVLNVYVMYRNAATIESNRQGYENAERVKVNTVEIIRNLHLVDMLLRSYALVPANRFLVSADSCVSVKDALLYTDRARLGESKVSDGAICADERFDECIL
jgi:hypothetical protein